MNHEQKLLGYYNYTVILTYIGMLTGFVGIIYAFEQKAVQAIVCLMIAGFCDMFDGTVASTRKRTFQEKCFGIQIDSLSDLICFGVLPAVITYNLNGHNLLVLGVCAMYVLCALVRLAYFNVDEQERQTESNAAREVYYGMPVTLSALFLPLLYGCIHFFSLRSYYAVAAELMIMAVLFLMPVQIKKPKVLGKICILLCGAVEVFLVMFACVDV